MSLGCCCCAACCPGMRRFAVPAFLFEDSPFCCMSRCIPAFSACEVTTLHSPAGVSKGEQRGYSQRSVQKLGSSRGGKRQKPRGKAASRQAGGADKRLAQAATHRLNASSQALNAQAGRRTQSERAEREGTGTKVRKESAPRATAPTMCTSVGEEAVLLLMRGGVGESGKRRLHISCTPAAPVHQSGGPRAPASSDLDV